MRQGFRLLGLSTEAVPEFVYTVTAARRSWAEQNKETVVRYRARARCRLRVHPRSRNREEW